MWLEAVCLADVSPLLQREITICKIPFSDYLRCSGTMLALAVYDSSFLDCNYSLMLDTCLSQLGAVWVHSTRRPSCVAFDWLVKAVRDGLLREILTLDDLLAIEGHVSQDNWRQSEYWNHLKKRYKDFRKAGSQVEQGR
jgi:hypothetical protein